jgi:hypothetical protein
VAIRLSESWNSTQHSDISHLSSRWVEIKLQKCYGNLCLILSFAIEIRLLTLINEDKSFRTNYYFLKKKEFVIHFLVREFVLLGNDLTISGIVSSSIRQTISVLPYSLG